MCNLCNRLRMDRLTAFLGARSTGRSRQTSPPPLPPRNYVPPAPEVAEFFNSDKIYLLRPDNIDSFLRSKAATMVVFYDPTDESSLKIRPIVAQAASCTKRSNHAYAAVNCREDRQLCTEYTVTKTPVFKLYDKDNLVTNFGVSKDLSAELLRKYVEQCPYLGYEYDTLPARK